MQMPNKLIANFIRLFFYASDRLRQNSFDYLIKEQYGSAINPFEIHFSVEMRTAQQIFLSDRCRIQARTILNGRSSDRKHGIMLGSDTYIKENCYFDAYGGFIEVAGQCAFAQNTFIHGGGGVRIGKNTIFGPNCYIIASNHAFGSRELPTMLQGDIRQGIEIGHNVWFGGNVTVLDGVKIGDNCVIGAGTVVAKSIPRDTLLFNAITPITREVFHD